MRIAPLFFLVLVLVEAPYIVEDMLEDRNVTHMLSLRDTSCIGIPISLTSICYIYISIIQLNMTR